MQQLRQLCLRTAGVVTQRMDEIDFRCANALFPQCQQDQLFCLARNFCDFPSGTVHKNTPII